MAHKLIRLTILIFNLIQKNQALDIFRSSQYVVRY